MKTPAQERAVSGRGGWRAGAGGGAGATVVQRDAVRVGQAHDGALGLGALQAQRGGAGAVLQRRAQRRRRRLPAGPHRHAARLLHAVQHSATNTPLQRLVSDYYYGAGATRYNWPRILFTESNEINTQTSTGFKKFVVQVESTGNRPRVLLMLDRRVWTIQPFQNLFYAR